MISLAKHFFKEFVSIIFYVLGGIYLLKYFLKNKNLLIILNYHNFSKYNNYIIKRGNILETGYKNNFEKQILFLKKHFNFCYPDDFFNTKNQRGINVSLTFDDGYKDNYDIALPILKKYNASTIFFLTTNYIGSNNWLWHDKVRYLVYKGILDQVDAEIRLRKMNKGQPVDLNFRQFVDKNFPKHSPKRIMMNWMEVLQINKMKLKLGSHTHNHKILSGLSYNQQLSELQDSIKDIENKTNNNCNDLAYPNGFYNHDTLELLGNLNIKFGYTTVYGVNKLNTSKKALKRIGVNASDKIYILLSKILLALLNEHTKHI